MLSGRLVLTVLVGLAGLLAAAAPAGAALPLHTQLLSSSPGDGATVPTAEEVTLTFSEEVNATFVQVRVEGPSGDETDGAPTTDGGTVTQPLVAGLAPGEHQVSYRVVSVDGHPVSGTIAFTTTDAAPTSAAPTTSAPSTSAPATTSAPSTPTPSPSTEPTSASEEGTPGWLVPVLVGLVALVLLVGGALLARGRGDEDEEPPAGP